MHLKNEEAGEMARCLRVFTAFEEVWGSVPKTLMLASNLQHEGV